MPLDRNRTAAYLKDFSFKSLFLEVLGWDQHIQRLDVSVDNKTYSLVATAHKRGMVAFECQIQNADFPSYPIRRKIDQLVTKNVREHIIIYTDASKTIQVWQWVKRETGRPTACREYSYHKGQSGEGLIQKLEAIKFTLDEEESLTLVDVTGRTRGAFDVEKITKKFYDRFKTEHDGFLKFIKGIPDEELHRWYASVMLNRLMFIYFIQKKGFLDKNVDYLRAKLAHSKERNNNKFYSDFLCPLFFDGFAKKEVDRSQAMNKLLGRVPYLNGGLFLKHQIEELHGKEIRIADAAFDKIFEFFEQYQWHLDERPLKEGNEINPDVLGYIFEKYINQKQMGAYYTKEDITEYISKNTVLPYLFDAAKQECKIAFEGDSSIWRLLQLDPDQYIYDAVKKGVELPLPEEIAKGLTDVSRRTEWNKVAHDEYALPTEIWRDVVARRKRYEEVKAKLASGEVRDINDFITHNLNIRQFAQDIIGNSEGPELLWAFYHSIEKVTVLDPTCGSGAFLFAALNILEPLYEACLDRMEVFVNEFERSGEKHKLEMYSDFTKILEQIDKHPNRKYFIYKSIILKNLYGVDIMEEAIEICKLRLFLKLVAQVGEAAKIDPLPDIDFNIRAGNTLIGFATYDEMKRVMESDMVRQLSLPLIEEKAQDVERLFQRFHEQQIELGGDITQADKQELRKRLKVLEEELNEALAEDYGIDLRKTAIYKKWLAAYKPFHWFIEFYGIIKAGGFDIVIGNPPYVEYSKIRNEYTIKPGHYITETTSNLYSFVVERSTALLHKHGALGLIVPLSAFCTQRMAPLIKLVRDIPMTKWVSHFGWRPSKLFDGVNIPLSILIVKSGQKPLTHTTAFTKWYSDYRPVLFVNQHYVITDELMRFDRVIPKIGNNTEISILTKVFQKKKSIGSYVTKAGQDSQQLYYRNTGGLYWRIFTDFRPFFSQNGKKANSSTEAIIDFPNKKCLATVTGIVNSNLFWFYYVVYSSFHHVNPPDILDFPVDFEEMNEEISKSLAKTSKKLMDDMQEKSKIRQRAHKGGNTSKMQTFYPSLSKPINDQIDEILKSHYGFTSEEVDYITNYDIKYRLLLDEDEEE